MISRRPVIWYFAILALAIEIAFDFGVCLWAIANIFEGDIWGAALASACRGAFFSTMGLYAIRGRNWGRIAIVVFDALQAVLGVGMSFLALLIKSEGHGVQNFLIVLSLSAFFGASAVFVGIGLKPEARMGTPVESVQTDRYRTSVSFVFSSVLRAHLFESSFRYSEPDKSAGSADLPKKRAHLSYT